MKLLIGLAIAILLATTAAFAQGKDESIVPAPTPAKEFVLKQDTAPKKLNVEKTITVVVPVGPQRPTQFATKTRPGLLSTIGVIFPIGHPLGTFGSRRPSATSTNECERVTAARRQHQSAITAQQCDCNHCTHYKYRATTQSQAIGGSNQRQVNNADSNTQGQGQQSNGR